MSAELNPEQQRAVDHSDGPLLVLAGAGSGKTRVLVSRIASLVGRGVAPWKILAVTFTNKAAGEMRERLFDMCGDQASGMWVGTFHATCARLLRRYGDRVGLTRDFTIFDDDDQKRLVTSILKELGVGEQMTARSVLWRIDQAKNRGDDPAELEIQGFGDEVVHKVYPIYRAALAREDSVDFNDLLLKVLELCRDREVGIVLESMFRHVLVDEFQDTNLVQYRLVRHFVRKTRNITVVGDDDQSIYGWRGAEPRNLLDFDRDFDDAQVIKLEQNYRSTKMILDAANAIISHNLDRHDKALWTAREDGDPILWEETSDERREADFIAKGILLLNDDGRDPADVAVLYRTHAQSRPLEEALRVHQLRYRIVGGTSFFQRREIKDIRGYLKLVLNAAADTAFERIVNVPSRGIGKTTVDRVRTHARLTGIGLFDAARSCAHGAVSSVGPSPRKKLGAFVDIVDELRERQISGASVHELIEYAIGRSGYGERLQIEDTLEARDRLDNLAQLVAMAADFDSDTEGKGTLTEFDERLSLSSVNDAEDGRTATAVTLMTIHAAKGLEFPVVFLCGMEDGLFPSLREREGTTEAEALEEERRLAYVAITRARDRLILTNARTRRTWAEVRMNRPSRFLDDIPATLMAVRARAKPVGTTTGQRGQRSRRRSEPQHDEFDQRTRRDEVPEYDAYADLEPSDELRAGCAVQHATFGTGRVLEAHGSGHNRKLIIEFPGEGIKTILARFVH